MFKNFYLKCITITFIYYLLTSGLSILLYLTLGRYLFFEYPNYLDIIETIVYVIILIIIFFFLKKTTKTSLSKDVEKNSLIKIISIIFTIAIIYRIIIDPLYRINIITGQSSYPTITEQFIPTSKKIITFLNFVILIPIIEEIVFRKIILKSLSKHQKTLNSLFISSFLFALVHINFYPFSFEYVSFINAFLIGLIAGVIYLKFGLLFCITFHAFFNLSWFILNLIYYKEYWQGIILLDFNFIYWLIIMIAFFSGIIILYKSKVFK
ncbi:hypothetical protein SY27_17580 [Flavobacterium sp. 316]|uniref:CPBP family intramembrane glutamic endopeptidase n=1 Tax=Flavobacterium sp. 316 TaxID=1603293 RepID=UPI0005E9243B|nr:hypothetical protein SY27_17580 [Flavobacterium sp. 316]